MSRRDLFGAYGDFLEILDNEGLPAEALKAVRSADSENEPDVFKQIREISEVFKGALDHIFFDNRQIARLTREYGVF